MKTKIGRLVVGAVASAVVLATLPASADHDSVGREAVACFHPNDEHLDTSCEQVADADEIHRQKQMCSGSGFVVARCSSIYRRNTGYSGIGESYVNSRQAMKTEFKVKYVCKPQENGVRVETWGKMVNIQDSSPPEFCVKEEWRLAGTSTRH